MKIIDCIQGSEEWYDAKCGVPTSSNFDKIITTKGEKSKQAEKYMFRLAGEKITGKHEDTYSNDNMQRGIEMEREAGQLYEIISGKTVTQVGFCLADNGNYGASPDRLIESDGLLEIKCPLLSTHVSYLINNKLPYEYFQQVQGQLFVTGRDYLDFMSYFPGIKPFIARVTPNKEFQEKLKVELIVFCLLLKDTIKKIGD